MSRDVLDEAYRHFELAGNRFEYGRPDMRPNGANGNPIDASRTEADQDRDGMGGVDCSSLVWRGLRNAGYDVPDTPFATSALFSGNTVTTYAHDNFAVIIAEDARATSGTLQHGDVLMFDSNHGRHVGLFAGYDEGGHIQFYGSQLSTGPALVSGRGTAPGGYWNGGDFEIVGALRPNPEFRVAEPLNAALGPVELDADRSRQDGPAARAVPMDPLTDGVLSRGETGDAVGALQTQLRSLGYTNARGVPIEADGDFGPSTEHAVRQLQTDRGLPVTGSADEPTRSAIDEATRALTERREVDRVGNMDRGLPPHASVAPTDPLFNATRDHVYAMDRSMGRTPDQASDRVAASLTAEWRANGLTAPIDGVVLGVKGTKAEAGEYVFAFSGTPERPNDWVGVKTAESVQTPVEQSMARAETLQREQATEAQRLTQAKQPAIDAPSRSMG